MTLLWILLGITVIILVARYNEDDALFWKLSASLVGAFIAAYITLNILNSEEKQSDQDLTQVYPTQVLSHTACAMPSLGMFDVLSLTPVGSGSNQKLVSQEINTPAIGTVTLFNSEVRAEARDQPLMFTYFDTS